MLQRGEKFGDLHYFKMHFQGTFGRGKSRKERTVHIMMEIKFFKW